MSLNTQLTEAKNKNKILAELLVDLRFLQDYVPKVMNVPEEITPQFKELCSTLLTTIDEIVDFKVLIPTFSNADNTDKGDTVTTA